MQERGHQVGQMRLVYQNAQRVVVWLGASNGQIDCLFDWMSTLDQHVLGIARPHTITTWENQWLWVTWHIRGHFPPDEIREALASLLQREWFSRIWVLQEAALAKSAIITCGRNEVHSRAFVVMPSLLSIDCSEGEQSRLDILPGLFRAKSWWAVDSSRDLSTLLRKFGRSKASDPRDIIYALLGLSKDAHSSQFLRPNYDMSLQETIQQCMGYLVMTTHNFQGHTTQTLPNWSLDEFLDYLQDLPLQVFQWATDNAHDSILYDILLSQRGKHAARHMQPYVNCLGRYGPPITIAIKKGNLALVELLLEFPETDIETTDFDGNTLLSIAVGRGDTVVANRILERTQRSVPRDSTLLLVGAMEGVSGETLLRNHPDLNIYANGLLGGDTRLTGAIKRWDWRKVRLILDHSQAEMQIADSNGDGPLNIAARNGDEKTMDLLLQKMAIKQTTFRGSDGLTPFESALAGGFSGIARKLFVYQSDAAQKAAKANQIVFLPRILDLYPHLVNFHWLRTRTALGVAAEAGSTSCVSLLLDRGAKVNEEENEEHPATPLWTAASRGHLDTVRTLFNGGARLETSDTKTSSSVTPFWIAALEGHNDVAAYLLKVGAQLEVRAMDQLLPVIKHRQGDTGLLNAAICAGRRDAVETLVEGGIDIDKSCLWMADGKNGESERSGQQTWAKPLWVAASLGHADIVSLLIQHGADMEARDGWYGMTPFQRAAQKNWPRVMTVLAEAGADTRLTK